MRLRFYQLFKKNADGTLSPNRTIRVGGIVMSPGVSFSKGVFLVVWIYSNIRDMM